MGNHKNGYQKQKKPNPALKQLNLERRIEAELKTAHANGINFASIVFEVMALDVLYNKHGFDDIEELKRFVKNLEYESELILEDYCTIPDILNSLREEKGFTLTDEQLAIIDPSLAGHLPHVDEE